MVSVNKIKLSIEKIKDVAEFISITNIIPCETTIGKHTNACSILGVLNFLFENKCNWFYLNFDKFVGEEVIEKFKKWEVK